jgi:hypothetical protein
MRLDTSGNLGLGVTPSAWGGSWKAVELNAGSMSSASNTDLLLAQNAYNDNTNWRYKTTALASAYAMAAGQHRFFTAPSGTAGNAITFTQAMTLDASGNLSVGTTGSTSSRLTVNADGATNYTNAQAQFIANSGDVILSLHAAGASAVCIDHIRGGGSVRIVNLTRSAFAPIEASAFVVSSDYRIKENVEPMTGASARLAQIPVYRFNYVEGSMSYRGGETVDGFLAHEVQSVVPEAVTGEKDAVNEDGQPILQGIDQSKLVPLLTAALQEALTEIASLKARLDAANL